VKVGREEQARRGRRCSSTSGALKKREASELAARTCASGSTAVLYAAEALAYVVERGEEGLKVGGNKLTLTLTLTLTETGQLK
jgi:hypothetical protein